jgi:hypothetical protein
MSELDLSRFTRVTPRDMRMRTKGEYRLRVGKNSSTLNKKADSELRMFPAYSWMIDHDAKEVLIRFEDDHREGTTIQMGTSNSITIPGVLQELMGLYREMVPSASIKLHRTPYGFLFSEADIERQEPAPSHRSVRVGEGR